MTPDELAVLLTPPVVERGDTRWREVVTRWRDRLAAAVLAGELDEATALHSWGEVARQRAMNRPNPIATAARGVARKIGGDQ